MMLRNSEINQYQN